MLIFCEQPHIFRDVNFPYFNKGCLCFDILQHRFCLVTERAIWFRVELELHRFGVQQHRLKLK